MPVITVTLLPGYPAESQHRLVQRLADTARSVIDALLLALNSSD